MPAERLLCGAQSIADAVGLSRRRVYTLAETDILPVFKIGGQLCASPSALRTWMERQTAEANRRAES